MKHAGRGCFLNFVAICKIKLNIFQPFSLQKSLQSNVFEITDEATQIFGGRAVTETGMGKIVNRAKRVVKNYKIYGGSEEIMAELGVREVMAQMPKDARL